MTDMVEAGNRFWREFSELCDRYVDAAPAHLRRVHGVPGRQDLHLRTKE
jgi:hypothetical protein